MQNKRIFVRLDRGEELVEQLLIVIRQYGVKLGRISGIGAVDKVTIGNFDAVNRHYRQEELTGDFEILNLSGNITEMDDEPYLHLHICIGDRSMTARGGHLNFGRISATAEIIIEIFEGNLQRYFDDESGLNLWGI